MALGPAPSGAIVGPVRRFEDWVAGRPIYRWLRTAGGMGHLVLGVARAAVVPAFSWRDTMVETAIALRRALIPLVLALSVYWYALGVVWFGDIIMLLGTLDRLVGILVQTGLREEAVWVTSMMIAGVVGSSMCSDLAARKVRGELDALAVLSVDTVKSLVAPRVVGLMIASALLGLIAMLVIVVISGVATILLHGTPSAVVLESIDLFALRGDIFVYLLKMVTIGAFVGVVATYKGLHAEPGPAGVGRAVNQTVLIAFIGVWIVNILGNFLALALMPDLLALRG
jgi:phospholipid/cholesterol/gamma-HCH transport system permease protein